MTAALLRRLRVDGSPLRFEGATSDGQAQPRPLLAGVASPERLEDGLELLLGDPVAVVSNVQGDVLRPHVRLELDAAGVGVFYRVLEDVLDRRNGEPAID